MLLLLQIRLKWGHSVGEFQSANCPHLPYKDMALRNNEFLHPMHTE